MVRDIPSCARLGYADGGEREQILLKSRVQPPLLASLSLLNTELLSVVQTNFGIL
jgi:hypothetical protein